MNLQREYKINIEVEELMLPPTQQWFRRFIEFTMHCPTQSFGRRGAHCDLLHPYAICQDLRDARCSLRSSRRPVRLPRKGVQHCTFLEELWALLSNNLQPGWLHYRSCLPWVWRVLSRANGRSRGQRQSCAMESSSSGRWNNNNQNRHHIGGIVVLRKGSVWRRD